LRKIQIMMLYLLIEKVMDGSATKIVDEYGYDQGIQGRKKQIN